jgi:hypothetical protein
MRSWLVILTLVMSIIQCAWPQSMPGGCIFPTMGKSVTNILNNTADPHNDGWKTSGNEFGNYCSGCVSYPGYHPGEDWNMACIPDDGLCDESVAVYAIADGKVILRDDDVGGVMGGVIIEHALSASIDVRPFIYPGTYFPSAYSPLRDKIRSGYLHLKGIVVSSGADIKKGDKIGEITNPGGGPHLHLEIQWRTDILGFPEYATVSEGRQSLTNRGLLDPTEFLKAQIANNAPAPYTYTDNGYTAYGPVVGGSSTNWEYSASPRTTTFLNGESGYAVMKIEQVRARHRFQHILYYKQNGSWVVKDSGQTAYNEASPTSIWEKAYFFPWMEFNAVGDWRLDASIDIGQGFVPLDSFPITVSAPARYTYIKDTTSGYTATGPMNYFTNWNYYAVTKRTSFRKGDSVYAVAKIINVTQSHFFHVDFYLNGVKQGSGWDTGLNTVNGMWDKAFFFPCWRNLPAGNCQMKLYVNFGQGNELLDTLSFSVSTSSTPYYVYYDRDLQGNNTSYMCKGPVTGGASTDWVYTGANKTNSFRRTDTPTALVRINDVKRNHRFKVVGYINDVHSWEYHMTTWNVVNSNDPWKWSYFWPEWRNPPVGNLRMEIYVDTGSGFPSIPVKKLSFTVTN